MCILSTHFKKLVFSPSYKVKKLLNRVVLCFLTYVPHLLYPQTNGRSATIDQNTAAEEPHWATHRQTPPAGPGAGREPCRSNDNRSQAADTDHPHTGCPGPDNQPAGSQPAYPIITDGYAGQASPLAAGVQELLLEPLLNRADRWTDRLEPLSTNVNKTCSRQEATPLLVASETAEVGSDVIKSKNILPDIRLSPLGNSERLEVHVGY